MHTALLIAGLLVASTILLVVANWVVWMLIPPLSPRTLATTGSFVSIDGIDTYYERYGSGPPILLIPAGGSHTSTWRFNIGALSRSHEVWTVDLPGSGYSDKPAAFPYTHRSYAEFVRAFMAIMNIPKAVVAGHSLGGTVALEFAIDFPELTTGLVLIAAGGYSRGAMPGALFLRRRTLNAILMSFSSYPAVLGRLLAYLYDNPVPFTSDSAFLGELSKINRTPNARKAYYWMQRALQFDFAIPDVSRIKSVAAPTLIVWGRNDRVIDARIASRFQQEIAGSQQVVIDGAGHMVHEEKPAEVNGAIASFIDLIRW
jgi:4,5:9,10-diseco-3-hydroxy-5,9,17-trioxoandrosta-1(10),2-diene-4-oate hydrolase